MHTRTTMITNPSGLHARPAAVFAQTAAGYSSRVSVRRREEGAAACDAKSIIRLMALGLGTGAEIEISAEGSDERAAVDALVALVESGCGE